MRLMRFTKPASIWLLRLILALPLQALVLALPGHPIGEARAAMPRPTYVQRDVFDHQYRDIRMGSVTLPEDWVVENGSVWAYNLIYHPFRTNILVRSPDNRAFIGLFPLQSFMWGSGALANAPHRGPSLGPIRSRPDITVAEAIKRTVIDPYRSRVQDLSIVGWRSVPTLPAAVQARMKGDSAAVRIRYRLGGDEYEEDIYGFLENVYTVSFDGPMGRSNEHHRFLRFAHSFAARKGTLDDWYPVLGFMHAQMQSDPRWLELHEKVYKAVNAQFAANMQRGWERIRAAGEASRAISARNDQMIRELRARQGRSDASRESLSRSFNEYIRGVERVSDSSGRTYEVTSGASTYWRSSSGAIVGLNSGNNPNVGSTTSWQQLSPAR